MADLQQIPLIESIKNRIDLNLEVSPNELQFLLAQDIASGTPASSDEISQSESFFPLVDLLGTEIETSGELGELLASDQTIDIGTTSQIPTREGLAEQAGTTQALGVPGEVMFGDMRKILMKAAGDIKTTPEGLPDFQAFIDEVQKLRGESEANRGLLEEELPVPFAEGETKGEVMEQVGVGAAAAFAASRGLGKIPSLPPAFGPSILGGTGRLLTRTEANVAGGGLGSLAAESLREGASIEDMRDAGLMGVGLDIALRQAGPFVRAGARTLNKKAIEPFRQTVLNKAGEMAFRVIQPVKKTMIRGIEKGGDSKAKIGRVLLEKGVMPSLPPFFLFKNIGVRLDDQLTKSGKSLGAVRKKASDFSDKLLGELNKVDVNKLPDDRKQLAAKEVQKFEKALRVDLTTVAKRVQDSIDVDPSDVTSETRDAVTVLEKQIDAWLQDPLGFRTIDQALKLKKDMRLSLQKKGALTEPAKTVARMHIEGILADEIDTAVSVALGLEKKLGNDFSQQNLERAFGETIVELKDLVVKGEKVGGYRNLPESEKTEFLRQITTHGDLQDLYRVLAKSDNLLFEKNLADATNNIFSLRDSLVAANLASTSPELALGGGVLSNLLRKRAVPTFSRATSGLATAVKGLQMSIGQTSVGIELMSDMATLTPGMYLMLTRPDSPLNNHGFMFVRDPAFIKEFTDRVADDDSLSSGKRSKIISAINKEGEIRISKKEGPASVDESPSLEQFRQKLEDFVGDQAPEGAPKSSFDFTQSPLFNKAAK